MRKGQNPAKFVKDVAPQVQAPKFSGTFTISYTFASNINVDLTGRVTGPMHLPVVPNDFRPAMSPWFGLDQPSVE